MHRMDVRTSASGLSPSSSAPSQNTWCFSLKAPQCKEKHRKCIGSLREVIHPCTSLAAEHKHCKNNGKRWLGNNKGRKAPVQHPAPAQADMNHRAAAGDLPKLMGTRKAVPGSLPLSPGQHCPKEGAALSPRRALLLLVAFVGMGPGAGNGEEHLSPPHSALPS